VLVDVITYEDLIPQEELIDGIQKANTNPKIHGIMLQLPLPEQYDQNEIVLHIDSRKDIDGLHPMNAGKLILGQKIRFCALHAFCCYGVAPLL